MLNISLVWMGSSTTSLAQLDRVQRRALHIISEHTWLPSLSLRRAVSAITYLYKLHCLDLSSPLRCIIPPQAARIPSTHSTRSRSFAAWPHQLQLSSDIPLTARSSLHRAFPIGIVPTWNSLPPPLLDHPPALAHMHAFKVGVFRFLRRHNWLCATDSL